MDDLTKILGTLTEEQKAALAQLLVPAKKKETHGPEHAKAKRVYFFLQKERHKTNEVKMTRGENGEMMIIEAEPAEQRVIATDEKEASKLFYKRRGKFQYLGTSPGVIWRDTRNQGKSVAEAQKAELEYALANQDLTPPMSKEKTFFSGTKISSVERGNEIDWNSGFKQRTL